MGPCSSRRGLRVLAKSGWLETGAGTLRKEPAWRPFRLLPAARASAFEAAPPRRKDEQMKAGSRTRVAVNGYGVIGKRVADAVARQNDMELAGVSDISVDWRPGMAKQKGFHLYGGHRRARSGDGGRRSRCCGNARRSARGGRSGR